MDYPILTNVQSDKSLRVMVFCCEIDPTQIRQDILFPYQSEIKINGGEIKANLRGLKNKPGSTRPVDITDALRLRQIGYANNIEMTYALTSKAGFSHQVSYRTLPPSYSRTLLHDRTSRPVYHVSVVLMLTFYCRNST
jgi:E3 SUMO-protein ligase PIAS1